MQRGGQICSGIVDVQHASPRWFSRAVRFVQTKKAHRQNVSGFAERDEAARPARYGWRILRGDATDVVGVAGNFEGTIAGVAIIEK
jgi:hypothetical protein